jgi:hypothetical protein
MAASRPPSSSFAPSMGTWLHAGRPRADITVKCRGSGCQAARGSLHAAIVIFGAVHGRRAACRQPPAPTSSSASVSVVEVDAPPRRRHLWRRSWAPGCMPAASRADVVVGFGKCRGSGRASAPSSSLASFMGAGLHAGSLPHRRRRRLR